MIKLKAPSLRKKTYLVTAAGTAITTGTFQLDTDRGRIIGISLAAASNTMVDIDGVIATARANGVALLEDVPLIEYSPLYEGEDRFHPVAVPQSTTLELSVNNDQAVVIAVYVSVYYE